MPESLAGVIVAVLGLDDRPQAQPRYLTAAPGIASPRAGVPLTLVQVANLYKFPGGDGTGQTVAAIELGGGFVPTSPPTSRAWACPPRR